MTHLVNGSIIVQGDVGRIFNLWADFENFPKFMKHVKSVQRTGNNSSRWIAAGPLGVHVAWNAEITRFEQNRRIAWRSTGGDIKTSGQVVFSALPGRQTVITLTLKYEPPAGMAANIVDKLFVDPQQQLDDDLRNFKAYVEGMFERVN